MLHCLVKKENLLVLSEFHLHPTSKLRLLKQNKILIMLQSFCKSLWKHDAACYYLTTQTEITYCSLTLKAVWRKQYENKQDDSENKLW